MSPELLDPDRFGLGDGRPTKESDCYALGMVIYEVLSGQIPFAQYRAIIVMRKVLDGKRPTRPQGDNEGRFTDDLWGMLELCWSPKPESHPSIETIRECLEGILRPPTPGEDDAEAEPGKTGFVLSDPCESPYFSLRPQCCSLSHHVLPPAQESEPIAQSRNPLPCSRSVQEHLPYNLALLALSPGSKPSESPKHSTSLSVAPPRKLAILGREDGSPESLPQFPQNPSHRPRHSIDTPPSLLPRNTAFGRYTPPDNQITLASSKDIPPRRVSRPRTRNPIYSLDSGGLPPPYAVVPFPRTVSTSSDQSKQNNATSDPAIITEVDKSQAEKPKFIRSRCWSEIDSSSSSRKSHPTSNDEAGQNPRRSSFESMVNLSVVTNTAGASDLLRQNALEDYPLQPTLIVREEGKPATHFVSAFFSHPLFLLSPCGILVWCAFPTLKLCPFFPASMKVFHLLTHLHFVLATQEFYRPWTVWSGIPGTKSEHRPEGCSQKDQLDWVEGK